jgi:hypothetical protein
MMTEPPSGNPQWEAPQGRGLPAIPAPDRVGGAEPEPARASSPVAEWLGWSPTSWRARGRR